MFQKGFLQAVRHNLQKAFFQHALKKQLHFCTFSKIAVHIDLGMM